MSSDSERVKKSLISPAYVSSRTKHAVAQSVCEISSLIYMGRLLTTTRDRICPHYLSQLEQLEQQPYQFVQFAGLLSSPAVAFTDDPSLEGEIRSLRVA